MPSQSGRLSAGSGATFGDADGIGSGEATGSEVAEGSGLGKIASATGSGVTRGDGVTGGVGLAYLAIKKTRLFARLVIWYFPFETLANVPYYVALVMHGPLLARSITDVVGAAAIAVIWVLYYRRSRRVRNTFVN